MALFIGGSYDGKRIEVREGLEGVYFPRRQSMRRVLPLDEIPAESMVMEQERYELMELRGGSAKFGVYVIAGMSGELFMACLLDGYLAASKEIRSQRAMSQQDRKREITMAEAHHIARIPYDQGTDLDIAREYGVDEEMVREIRKTKGYKGVAL